MPLDRGHVSPPDRPCERRHETALAYAGERSLCQGEQSGGRLFLAPTSGLEQLNPLAQQDVDIVRCEDSGRVVWDAVLVADVPRLGAECPRERTKAPHQGRGGGVDRDGDSLER